MPAIPSAPLRSYDLLAVDQLELPTTADILPPDPGDRREYARMLAMDATIYGLPSAFEYAQLYEQAVDGASDLYTGFNRFLHQRDLATPSFTAFKTPNVDTLYSNAWLDLTGGPVEVRVPPMEGRYFTLQFVDLYGNATNLSSRTVGAEGGRFAVTTTTWDGPLPDGLVPFRVGTPFVWILMRILVKDAGGDVDVVRRLQDEVRLSGTGPSPAIDFPAVTAKEVETEAGPFLAALDWTLRHNGRPAQEEAYVHRFSGIGLGGRRPFSLDELDPAVREGVVAGFRDAMAVVEGSRALVGERTATGWRTGTAGELGFNYLHRAVQNFVGTGGNVTAEKKFFVAFEGGDGAPLDGRRDHRLRFDVLPPVDGGWSLTVYPTDTGLLYDNEIDRYAIGSTTAGLVTTADGALEILLQHRRPAEPSNWLPVPDGPFYVDLRMWEPRAEARDGRWIPPAIEAR
ncbi:MAG TPA: DUF1254 domain-containing protein [Acidimicrobiales bacterium]